MNVSTFKSAAQWGTDSRHTTNVNVRSPSLSYTLQFSFALTCYWQMLVNETRVQKPLSSHCNANLSAMIRSFAKIKSSCEFVSNLQSGFGNYAMRDQSYDRSVWFFWSLSVDLFYVEPKRFLTGLWCLRASVVWEWERATDTHLNVIHTTDDSRVCNEVI